MTKDDIISLPNDHLRQRSKTVSKITPRIRQVIEDMKSATLSWDESREHEVGVALAAVQIDKLYRIVIVRNDHDNKQDHGFKVLINPEIIRLDGEIVEDFEGCLSVPNVYGKVPRYDKVSVKALDPEGEEITLKAKGFLSRIFQHELDHTEGIVFIDRIRERPESFFVLNEEGKLEPLNYKENVENNPILWQ